MNDSNANVEKMLLLTGCQNPYRMTAFALINGPFSGEALINSWRLSSTTMYCAIITWPTSMWFKCSWKKGTMPFFFWKFYRIVWKQRTEEEAGNTARSSRRFRVQFSSTISRTQWLAASSKAGRCAHASLSFALGHIFLTHFLCSNWQCPEHHGERRNRLQASLFDSSMLVNWDGLPPIHLIFPVLCPWGSPGSKPGCFSSLALESKPN